MRALCDDEQTLTLHRQAMDQTQARKCPLDPQSQAWEALDLGVTLFTQALFKHFKFAVASDSPRAHARLPSRLHRKHAPSTCMLQLLARVYGCSFKPENTLLCLAFLACGTDEENTSLNYIQQYCQHLVDAAPAWCWVCGQIRGDDAILASSPQVTCSGCRVARFRHKDQTKRGGSFRETVWHKALCPLLKKWRQKMVSKRGGSIR